MNNQPHPYLAGNFAPITTELPLTPCSITGTLPPTLRGGQYIRNGSNPLHAVKGDQRELREYHWFDGDGMLSGVLFGEAGEAWFVNKMLVTDVLLASERLERPVLPSIASLVDPNAPTSTVLFHILRSFVLCMSTHLTTTPLGCLSVANTSILFHSCRALAWCEAGPPLEVRLPTLDTVDWHTFKQRLVGPSGQQGKAVGGLSRGGDNILGFFNSWTSAHPHVDPVTGEMLLLHSSFIPPYLRYSVIDARGRPVLLSAPIPLKQPKMMHDFAASATHTIVLDLPLVFGPANLLQGRPILHYDRTLPSKFGIVPRYLQGPTTWFEDDPCVVFHTANAWDNVCPQTGEVEAVNLLCCRFKTDGLVFAAGNLPLLSEVEDPPLLHYFRFPLSSPPPKVGARPSHSFPLLSIPFEFPCIPPLVSTRQARYVFGCSMRESSFTAALGGASKIDCLVRVDVLQLISLGLSRPASDHSAIDKRPMPELLTTTTTTPDPADSDPDPIRIFTLPPLHYARTDIHGHLLFYVFDESQLLPDGRAPQGARSELWVLDARDMRSVVARVGLAQRVPYGLHGSFVTREQIAVQLPDRPIRLRPTYPPPPLIRWSWIIQLLEAIKELAGMGGKGKEAERDPVDGILRLLALVQLFLGVCVVVRSYLAAEGEGGMRFGMEL